MGVAKKFNRKAYFHGKCCSRCLAFNEGFESDRLKPPFTCPILRGPRGGKVRCYGRRYGKLGRHKEKK